MFAEFWAGYISGAAGIVVGNPLDLIKVRLQASAHTYSPPNRLRNTASLFCVDLPSDLAATSQGTARFSAKSLFRGLPAPVLTYGALNAVLFGSYNYALVYSSYLDNKSTAGGRTAAVTPREYPYWGYFAAGCFAGIATFFISAPTELVKCRAQVSKEVTSDGRPVSSWVIARRIYARQGLVGLYEGGIITSIRDSIGYGFYFLSYEASKDIWDATMSNHGFKSTHEPQFGQHTVHNSAVYEATKILLCGGLAGVVSWSVIFPLDVIKTRAQTQNLEYSPSGAFPSNVPASSSLVQQTVTSPATHYGTTTAINAAGTVEGSGGSRGDRLRAWSIAQQAYRTEGLGVFVRGLRVCCARAFIVNAVQWAVYEWVMACFLQ